MASTNRAQGGQRNGDFRILKVSTGLDPVNLLDRMLGPGFAISAFDPKKPLRDQVGDADVLLLREVPVPHEVVEVAGKLKLMQRYGQHLTGVDVRRATAKGVYVARVPTELTGANRMVAEHAVFLMMAVAKRYHEATRSIRERRVSLPKTVGLTGKTLGMVGLGQTGIELIRLLRGFDMRIMVVKRSIDPKLKQELGISYMGAMNQMNEMLRQSDFVSIHLPLEESTTGYFGKSAFAAMKKGAFLINIARAPIVDRPALDQALADGQLSGAGLDVMWEEPMDPEDSLLRHPNVVVTPHIAGSTSDMHEKLTTVVAENIRLVASGKPPQHQVSPDEH
ncbi:MAG: hypothetical protein IT562_04660 [Alphaproteobacteria bacterium]|nr:hypothetical protein [Alphaproteobacteria bacterium]